MAANIAVTGCSIFDLFANHQGAPTVLWHVNGSGAGSPAYDGSTVYVLADNHTVLALDGGSGAQRWVGRTFNAAGPPFGFGGCQIAAALVVCADSTLVALRRADGTLAWRFRTAVRSNPGFEGFVVRGETIYAGSPNGTLYAVDAVTGEQRWAQSMLTGTGTTINVVGVSADDDIVTAAFNRFVIPLRGGVIALDARTGVLRWLTDYPRPASDSLTGGTSTALWNDVVLGSSADGRIYALNRANGAVQWEFPGVGKRAGAPFGADLRELTLSGSTLYAGSSSGWYIAYDLTNRRERWRVFNGSSDQGTEAAIDGNTIYLVVANGHLKAFADDQAKELWDYGEYASFSSKPILGSDRIFLSGPKGFWALSR